MSTFVEQFKKSLGEGMRDALRPGVAYGLKKMYGHYFVSVDWNDEANELLLHMKDYAKAQRAKK